MFGTITCCGGPELREWKPHSFEKISIFADYIAAFAKTPKQAPTFAFLDPDGMELEWRTVKLLADHKRGKSQYKIEMWILLSTSGLVRMLGDFADPHAAELNEHRVRNLYGATGPWER